MHPVRAPGEFFTAPRTVLYSLKRLTIWSALACLRFASAQLAAPSRVCVRSQLSARKAGVTQHSKRAWVFSLGQGIIGAHQVRFHDEALGSFAYKVEWKAGDESKNRSL